MGWDRVGVSMAHLKTLGSICRMEEKVGGGKWRGGKKKWGEREGGEWRGVGRSWATNSFKNKGLKWWPSQPGFWDEQEIEGLQLFNCTLLWGSLSRTSKLQVPWLLFLLLHLPPLLSTHLTWPSHGAVSSPGSHVSEREPKLWSGKEPARVS